MEGRKQVRLEYVGIHNKLSLPNFQGLPLKPLLYVKKRLPEEDFSDSEEKGKTVKEWDYKSEEDYESDDSEEDEKNSPWFPNQEKHV